ncbi:hypothetical protein Mp_2g24270 [Marchantia polymorpha subsp. ruderalis]|uniref:Uncharacterized protein n=1 Tax=Marchantia polymorpha TaxID=3197 RepID=A0A2R6WPG8_MARPO|nr:hypothetical protein MARPO_0069s0076 [Marchantia polymorpha]BBN03535.1 hypothetical protein Mp_2g24270 [Marchantia polymorpha subsp. ruderalis]|eukprot:PTQ35741.1 hypothetical protein MARPO_0069s0076 [Marchantia polymorpha]
MSVPREIHPITTPICTGHRRIHSVQQPPRRMAQIHRTRDPNQNPSQSGTHKKPTTTTHRPRLRNVRMPCFLTQGTMSELQHRISTGSCCPRASGVQSCPQLRIQAPTVASTPANRPLLEKCPEHLSTQRSSDHDQSPLGRKQDADSRGATSSPLLPACLPGCRQARAASPTQAATRTRTRTRRAFI